MINTMRKHYKSIITTLTYNILNFPLLSALRHGQLPHLLDPRYGCQTVSAYKII
jgi:hypothetical protein